jgi:hypothetical protein
MSRPSPLYEWRTRVATACPEIPAAYARGLAEWSFGLAQAGCAALSGVAVFLAAYLQQAFDTVRQRLRDLYLPGDQKAGASRTTFDVRLCCPGLFRWITATWADRRLALALDPTTLGDRFTVLTVALVYRGCGIPLAWTVLEGNEPEAGNPIWKELLGRVRAAIGGDWFVCVCTDRGLESKDLFEAITGHGWHPLMRAKVGGTFRPAGWARFHPLPSFVGTRHRRFGAAGTAYKSNPLGCTLLACQMDGCEDPWLILTDLPPSAADPCWYAFRSWIEQGFRIIKRGGWQWHRTRMEDADRVERVWAAIALATLWMVEVGGLDEHEERAETVPPIKRTQPKAWPVNRPGRERRHRLFTRGLAVFRATLLRGEEPRGQFNQEPWPQTLPFPAVGEAEIQAKCT